MSRMEMRCGTTKCERCGKESVITIRHKLYDAQFCADCYNDANDNKELFLTGVELAPVIHAYWIDTLYGWKCSNCKEEQEYTLYLKHCPNCGAKMDEEVEE